MLFTITGASAFRRIHEASGAIEPDIALGNQFPGLAVRGLDFVFGTPRIHAFGEFTESNRSGGCTGE